MLEMVSLPPPPPPFMLGFLQQLTPTLFSTVNAVMYLYPRLQVDGGGGFFLFFGSHLSMIVLVNRVEVFEYL